MSRGLLACGLSVVLFACGDSASGAGGAGGGGGGSGAAGGAGGEACACTADYAYDDKTCFCLEAGFGCGSEITIDDVLQPTCPGVLIHPISPSCEIGGVFYLIGEDFVEGSHKYLFDRDSDALVGLYASSDVAEYCDTLTSTVRWGEVAASCELCDPCSADNPDYPPCPEPAE